MSTREISLSGGEIAIIKALGTSGSAVAGDTLVGRMDSLEDAELIDTLLGLIAQDYVESDRSTFRTIDDVNRATFKTEQPNTSRTCAAPSARNARNARSAAAARSLRRSAGFVLASGHGMR